MPDKRFQFEIIGHRGCEGLAKDNSIEAMEKAIELGIDRVEFDLRLTRDRKIVVFHDASIKLDGKRTRISSLTRTELFKEARKRETSIPSFSEVLNVCSGKIKIQAEIKDTGMEKLFWNDITSTGFPIKDLHVSSFNMANLRKVKDLKPGLEPVQLVYLLGATKVKKRTISRMNKHGIGSISLKKKYLNEERVKYCHDNGIRVIAYGVGEKRLARAKIMKIYESLIDDIGLDGFTSAYPNLVKEIIEGRK